MVRGTRHSKRKLAVPVANAESPPPHSGERASATCSRRSPPSARESRAGSSAVAQRGSSADVIAAVPRRRVGEELRADDLRPLRRRYPADRPPFSPYPRSVRSADTRSASAFLSAVQSQRHEPCKQNYGEELAGHSFEGSKGASDGIGRDVAVADGGQRHRTEVQQPGAENLRVEGRGREAKSSGIAQRDQQKRRCQRPG